MNCCLHNFSTVNLAKFLSAIAAVRSGAANCPVAVIGDSVAAGVGSPGGNGWANARAASYPSILAGLFNSTFLASGADSFFGMAGSNSAYSNYNPYDPRVTLGSGWGYYSSNSIGGFIFDSLGSVAPLSFAPGCPFDTIDVYYLANSAFSVNIGGAPLWSCPGGGDSSISKKTINGVSLGSHTINVVPGGGNPTYIVGIHVYNSVAKKISVLDVGFGGAMSSDWADASQAWSPLSNLPVLAPALSIIDLGRNDVVHGMAPLTFLSNVQAIINAVSPTGSVILIAPNPISTTLASVATQTALSDALYALSNKNGAPLIDMGAAWQSYATANANGFYFDTEHPSAAGHFDIAFRIAAALSTTTWPNQI